MISSKELRFRKGYVHKHNPLPIACARLLLWRLDSWFPERFRHPPQQICKSQEIKMNISRNINSQFQIELPIAPTLLAVIPRNFGPWRLLCSTSGVPKSTPVLGWLGRANSYCTYTAALLSHRTGGLRARLCQWRRTSWCQNWLNGCRW